MQLSGSDIIILVVATAGQSRAEFDSQCGLALWRDANNHMYMNDTTSIGGI